MIICLLISKNASYPQEKFKIIAEEIPMHSFYENEKNATVEKSKIVGSDIDIATRIFTKLKVPIEIELVHWTKVLPMLKTGAADMALGIQKLPAIQKYAYFPRTPSRSRNYVFYGLYNVFSKVHTMEFERALKHNLRVGIVIGFTYPKEFWETYPFEDKQLNSHLYEGNSYRENIIKLRQNKIDLFIADKERASLLLKKVGADETIFQYKNILYWRDYYFAFSKKTKFPKIEDLQKKLERELYKMTESDEIPEINTYWIKKGL